MEVINWDNGNGQTLQLTRDEAAALNSILTKAIITGHANAVLDVSEIDVEVVA